MYTAKDFARLIGMEGFSRESLESHFKLYEGYVEGTNESLEALEEMRGKGKADTRAFAEIKRRLGWEFNGMRLHEYYFENLRGMARPAERSGFDRKIETSFGNYADWETDFRATAAMRGIGWTILYQDRESGRLLNFWINEHDVSHPAGASPLLVLDVFEHAYLTDYGLKRDDYIQAFLDHVAWDVVMKRWQPVPG